MKKIWISAFVILILGLILNVISAQVSAKKQNESDYQFKEGDIIFQTGNSQQCEAIRLATGSTWTHCGMIIRHQNEWAVLEAVQPVKITPLKEFISHGIQRKYEVLRLKDESLLTNQTIAEMKAQGMKWLGKNYDIYFAWTDDELYCSELVWKLYATNAGLRIGEPLPLKEYDLDHPLVREIMQQRYGNNIPAEEPMISPGSIHDSHLLKIVKTED